MDKTGFPTTVSLVHIISMDLRVTETDSKSNTDVHPLWSLLESIKLLTTLCSGPIVTVPALVYIDSILHGMHS